MWEKARIKNFTKREVVVENVGESKYERLRGTWQLVMWEQANLFSEKVKKNPFYTFLYKRNDCFLNLSSVAPISSTQPHSVGLNYKK